MGNVFGCIQVEQSSLGIKETFGVFEDVLTPGFHHMPWWRGSKLAGCVSLRVQQLDLRCETLTKDGFSVMVVASIQYRAMTNNTVDAYYELSNTMEQIQACVFDVIRSCVPKLELRYVFNKKRAIAKRLEHQLEKTIPMNGYEIVQTLIVDIELDIITKEYLRMQDAGRLKRLAANERAETEKSVQRVRAAGESYSKYSSGLATASQHEAIINGLKERVVEFSSDNPGISAKDVMDMILVTQYFDTMKEIGSSPKLTSELIQNGPGALKDVFAQIQRDARGDSSNQNHPQCSMQGPKPENVCMGAS